MANIEIDGRLLNVENGKTIIEVADEHGIPIPRFCYHKKLAVAANCRMCLVEVEKSRKPLPACATTVTEGMKIFTKSAMAVEAQKAVMEFLLINHPLDCPICDQGGECELQDVSLGFGEGFSDYVETKRSVQNDDLGSLVATEMTRCIHCTRCVRFGQDIAGIRELGGTGRGEHMQIGTYVQHSLQSEISANIIDLCPVGALTSKPFRFQARAWELQQHASVAPHDALGSNIELHVRRDKVMRVVPKENESINETWISDRDRFSYLSIDSEQRLKSPMIKENGVWQTTDWSTALKKAIEKISAVIEHHGFEEVAAFASPSSTLEELYLFQKLLRSQGIRHIDHRLHQADFRDQDAAPLAPVMAMPYEDIEKQHAILLLGSHLNHEQPLANVRVRKAALQGAKIMAINAVDYALHYDLAEKVIVSPQYWPFYLLGIVKTMAALAGKQLPKDLKTFDLPEMPEDGTINDIATCLHNHKPSAIILGALAQNHPQAALIRRLVNILAQWDVNVIAFTEGSNAAGAWLAGAVPHRGPMGQNVAETGWHIKGALESPRKAYIGFNVNPQFDIANPHLVHQALSQAEAVVWITSFADDNLLALADVLLPAAVFAETSGTYVNAMGTWQTVKGVVSPHEEARPAWKIFRVLGNLWHAAGFDYTSTEEVLTEIKALQVAHVVKQDMPIIAFDTVDEQQLMRVGEWPLYRSDDLCRHAQALQHSAPGKESIKVRMHPETADAFGLTENTVTLSQNKLHAVTLPFERDSRIATGVICIPCALPESVDLGDAFAPVTIRTN